MRTIPCATNAINSPFNLRSCTNRRAPGGIDTPRAERRSCDGELTAGAEVIADTAALRAAIPVYLVEDDPEVRDLLRLRLEEAGYLVTGFASAETFLAEVDPGMRGCVVTDVRMAPIDGVELTARLQSLAPQLHVVVITGFADVGLAVQAMKAGARDFIEKSPDLAQLFAAVRDSIDELAERGDVGERDEAASRVRLATLSQRERQILAEIGAGYSAREIAERLGISGRTVDAHRARIMLKMGAPRLAHLVRIATLLGV